MMNCLFCKITKKEISAEIIYEDEAAVGVLDINPRAPGHAMILPKVHAETLVDLPEGKVGPVFSAVGKTVEILQSSLNPDGFTIGINQGRAAGQVIGHLHIHIIPRWENDGGGSIHSVVNNPPKESLEEVKGLIEKFKPKA